MITDKMVTVGLLGIMVGSLSYNKMLEKLKWCNIGKDIIKQKVPGNGCAPKSVDMTREACLKPYNERFRCL